MTLKTLCMKTIINELYLVKNGKKDLQSFATKLTKKASNSDDTKGS